MPDATAPRNADASAIDWASVLQQHERWMRTVLLARLRDLQAVDDVMQEISLAAVKQQAPLQDAAKVAPWLYQLAVRQALQYRRKAGRARKLANRYAEHVQPTEQDQKATDPLDWLLAAERNAAVCAALGRLPRRDAEILMLKYTESWSYRQIAAHLGLTESAIEARLHRARTRMRRELAKAEVTDEPRTNPHS